MAVPADVTKLVTTWCEAKSPPDMRDQARLEADIAGNKVTIFECTRMPDEEDWLRVPSAQLRLDPVTRIWALYWIDSHDRWHLTQTAPTLDVVELLREVDADRDCLFFG